MKLYDTMKSARMIVWTMVLVASINAMCADTIQISGRYTVEEFTKQNTNLLHVDFLVRINEDSWLISVSDSLNKTNWAEIAYDGTNTYTLMPYTGHFVAPPPEGSKRFATIYPGKHYLTAVSDSLLIYFPWITFAVSPKDFKINNSQSSLPLPWKYSLKNISAYGYRWNFAASPDAKFIAHSVIFRDHSLDLSFEKELLRPQLSYPLSQSEYNRQLDLWKLRELIPSGFEDSIYECTGWQTTNNMTIPASATFKHFIFRQNSTPWLYYSASLVVTGISFTQDNCEIVPRLDELAFTRDFRYKRKNDTRIYNNATYVQKPGDWRRGDDPGLLLEAENVLKHGPKYGDYGWSARLSDPRTRRRTLAIIAVFVIIQLPFTIFLASFIYKKQKARKMRKNNINKNQI